MSDNPHANASQSHRVKWGLVLVLGLLLGYLVFRSDDASPATENTASTTAGPQSNPVTKAGPGKHHRPSSAAPQFPPVEITEVLTYNPFEFRGRRVSVKPKPQVADDAPSTRTADRQQQRMNEQKRRKQKRDELKRQQQAERREQIRQSLAGTEADIILESPRGRTARIGDRIVHEGKRFREGTSVRKIDASHIILEIPDSPDVTDSPDASPDDSKPAK